VGRASATMRAATTISQQPIPIRRIFAPVSIAVHDVRLCRPTKARHERHAIHRVSGSDSGRLTPLHNSTHPASADSQPGDVFFNFDGNHPVGTEVGTTDPSQFKIIALWSARLSLKAAQARRSRRKELARSAARGGVWGGGGGGGGVPPDQSSQVCRQRADGANKGTVSASVYQEEP